MLAVKLKELDLQIKKQECEEQKIRLRAIEAQADRDIKMRELDLRAQELNRRPVPMPRSRLPSALSSVTSPAAVSHQDSDNATSEPDFDVGRYLKLVPPFREAEVDSYFVAFERVAMKLRWPKDVWALLLQCSLSGKAQEVCSALPIDQSLDYDTVKSAVLRAFELVPEAYRQKFRSHVKTAKQTFVEFAREKKTLFERWCLSSGIMTLDQLQELVLLEDFKGCIPENVVVHLNEQRVASLFDAAVVADEFVLTHRTVFPLYVVLVRLLPFMKCLIGNDTWVLTYWQKVRPSRYLVVKRLQVINALFLLS